MKITSIQIRIILFITFIVVGLVTYAQDKATYQVAYSDYQITSIEGGWMLVQEPVSNGTINSNVITANISNAAFPIASLAINHAGRTNYYSVQNGVSTWLGFSELSQNYVFKNSTFNSFYQQEVSDSLMGNFGNFSYYKKSTPLSNGQFQMASKNYLNVQNVQTVEVITENKPFLLTKIRNTNSFYQNGSQLPFLEYISDTLRTQNTQRIIEFVLYNNGIVSKIEDTKINPSNIYPNPTSGLFNFTNNTGEEGILKIINLTGELLFEMRVTDSKSVIDVSGLNTGVYIMEFNTEKTIQSTKLLKQ